MSIAIGDQHRLLRFAALIPDGEGQVAWSSRAPAAHTKVESGSAVAKIGQVVSFPRHRATPAVTPPGIPPQGHHQLAMASLETF